MDASLDVKRHGAVSDQLSAVSNQRTTKLRTLLGVSCRSFFS
jgi:hypothetical protein